MSVPARFPSLMRASWRPQHCFSGWRRYFHHVPHAVSAEYAARLARGELRPDALQSRAVTHLDALADRLVAYKPSKPLWGSPPPPPKGLYMYGDVGSGKTMLMDLFLTPIVRATPSAARNRVHFNSFMSQVHSKLHHWRSQPSAKHAKAESGIAHVASEIISNSPLLCFDEFQVTNVADAMLLGRLFEALWLRGAVVLATSNRHPSELYKGGLQRDLFLPFIHELQRHCELLHLDSDTDYRLTGTRLSVYHMYESSKDMLFHDPSHPFHSGPNRLSELNEAWDRLRSGQEPDATKVFVASGNRSIRMKRNSDLMMFSRLLCRERNG